MAGKIVADTLEHSTAGSVNTNFVVEGVAKCWITHQHADTIDDSFNHSTLTDSGTGLFICNFTTNMASAKYICGGGTGVYNSAGRGGDFVGMNMGGGSTDNRASDHCDVAVQVSSNASSNSILSDRDWSMHIFHGDLS